MREISERLFVAVRFWQKDDALTKKRAMIGRHIAQIVLNQKDMHSRAIGIQQSQGHRSFRWRVIAALRQALQIDESLNRRASRTSDGVVDYARDTVLLFGVQRD